MFADAGLSGAQISSLFIIWSATAFAAEIPAGVLADLVSRRLLVAVSPLFASAAFALWTFFPSYLVFAVGFVVWGVGDSLKSGALEALVYEELDRVGGADAYPRLVGRSLALGNTAAMLAMLLAVPVLAAGGYLAVGLASVAVPLLAVPVAASMPESRDRQRPAASGAQETPEERPEPEGFVAVLRSGLAEIRGAPRVLRAVLLLAVIAGFPGALEEYVPLLARGTGVGEATVPVLVLVVFTGAAVGGWLAGRATRWTAPALAFAAACLALGSAFGHPAGLVGVAVAFGVFYWAMATAEARLQDRVSDTARATVTSVAGFGAEVVAVLTYAAYALGSLWNGPGWLFAAAALPTLLIALGLRRRRS